MKNLKQTLFSLVVILVAGVIAACIDDSNAQSSAGVTRAEYDALVATVATLQAKVTALEANQPGDKVFAGAGSVAKATTAEGQPIGTMLGYVPGDGPVFQSSLFSMKSSTGYLYAVPNGSSADGQVLIGGYGASGAIRPIYFESADCSGPGYVPGDGVSGYGAVQGTVFRIGHPFGDKANTAQYYAVVAGTEPRNGGLAYGSLLETVGQCTVESGALTAASYQVAPNDPAVTGVDNAPIAAPVKLEAPPA